MARALRFARAVSMMMLVGASAACSAPAAAPSTAVPTAAPKPAGAATTAPAQAAAPTSAPAAPQSAAPAGVAGASAGSSQWYEAAKKEGALVVYGIGGEQFAPLKKGFEARYPGIVAEGLEQSGQQTREKIIAEAAAKQLKADVASAGGTSFAALVDNGLIESYTSPEAANLVPELVDPRGLFTPRVVNLYGITINTDAIKPEDEPKSWKDLLNPKWKGKKIAMVDPRGSGSGGTVLYGVEKTLGPEFTQQLAAQDLFFGRENAALVTSVVRGEQPILLTATSRNVVEQKSKGAPIKLIKPVEGVAVTPINIGAVKGAPHPNAAKLVVDWILSEEGQVASAAAGDAPARKGAKPAYPESDLTGVKILPRDDAESGTPAEVERMKNWGKLFFGS
jgi:iron(III) transport system substrate-binding protein